LPVGGKRTVTVTAVLDEHQNEIPGAKAKVTWQLDPKFKPFIYMGPQEGASVDIVWLAGSPELEAPSQVPVIATYEKISRVVMVKYGSAVPIDNTLTTDKSEIQVVPGQSQTFTVTVNKNDDSHAAIPKISIKTTLGPKAENPEDYLTVTSDDDKKTVTVTGKYGNPTKPTPLIFSLGVKAAGAMNIVAVRYVYAPVKVIWDVVPPNIVGDNYGRTIKNDYYCIEVTVQNFSGDDVALAGFTFHMRDAANPRPATSYSTAHGSLARRKLTYPRTIILAAISAAGQLMTGFNPFFHNVQHAKNFSQFIDVISNPLEKGLTLVWPDAYPDELARFEQDVLKDDKVIPSGGTFKTKIFIPKRDVFPTSEYGDKKNLDDVRNNLGNLEIFGYKFQRGTYQTLTDVGPSPQKQAGP
jgi:hypothetical protein